MKIYETFDEFVFRRYKEGMPMYFLPAFIVFSIPIINVFCWMAFIWAYYEKRKVKNYRRGSH